MVGQKTHTPCLCKAFLTVVGAVHHNECTKQGLDPIAASTHCSSQESTT